MSSIHRQDVDVARRSNFIAAMPPDVVEAIMSRSDVHSGARGATIFRQGEPATSIYVVLNGWVKLYRTSQNGEEAVVGVFAKGESFGEAVVMAKGRYPVTAQAVTDCRLLQIDGSVLLDLVRRRPELAGSILSSMYIHFHALVGQIEQLKALTGPQRLAEFLLGLATVETGECSVRLPYDKALVAGRLGMKPESLSRAFAQLRKVGVAVNQGDATISDVSKLRDFANRDRALAWSKTR